MKKVNKSALSVILSIIFVLQMGMTVFAAEEKPAVIVGGAEVHNINSVGGVEVEVYWKNNLDTPVKYIYFDVLPYNAVGDVVASQIGQKTQARLQITGPVYTYNPGTPGRTIYYKVPADAGYGKEGKSRWLAIGYQIGWDYKKGYSIKDISNGSSLVEAGYYHYYNYMTQKNVRIRDEDTAYFLQQDLWGPVWYNNTVRSIKVVGVEVEWMDGTTKSYYGDDLKEICQVRAPKPKTTTKTAAN